MAKHKTLLRYCGIDSHVAGEDGHPEAVIKRLLRGRGVVVAAEPVPISDAWGFWIEHEHALPQMPQFVMELEWRPLPSRGTRDTR